MSQWTDDDDELFGEDARPDWVKKQIRDEQRLKQKEEAAALFRQKYREWGRAPRAAYLVVPPRKPALWRRIVRAVHDFIFGD